MPFLSQHWSGENRLIHFVEIEFDVLLNASVDPILTENILKQGNLSSQNCTPQTAGIQIKPELTEELEAVWFDFITIDNFRNNPLHSRGSEARFV